MINQNKNQEGRKLKWGILSTARINRRVIPAILTAPSSELAGVAGREKHLASEFARRWEIPLVFDSYEELLASPEIDAVYIPLPNVIHGEWVTRAARAGKHVLCEKPLALSVEEVDEIIGASAEKNVVVLEGMAYRFHPQFLKLEEMIKEGLIGKVKLIRAHYTFILPRGDVNIRWRQEMGGGSLWDVGCYPVSFARAVAGENPGRVFAEQQVGPTGVDILLMGQLTFPGGVIAQVHSGFCLPFRAGAEIVGEEGTIILPNPWQPDVDGKRSGLVHVTSDDHEALISTEVIDPYLCEVRAMERAVLGGVPPPFGLKEVRGTIAALSALSKSAQAGKAVSVN